LNQLPRQFEGQKSRVTFVEMKDAGIGSQRLQRADAADAEDDLLLKARFAIALFCSCKDEANSDAANNDEQAVRIMVIFMIGLVLIELKRPNQSGPR